MHRTRPDAQHRPFNGWSSGATRSRAMAVLNEVPSQRYEPNPAIERTRQKPAAPERGIIRLWCGRLSARRSWLTLGPSIDSELYVADLNTPNFSVIAERSFDMRGPVDRTVVAKIGMPEPDPQHPGCYRCPFQVTGLANDRVQFAVGVDSFQALNLAFGGIRSAFKTSASVLSAFHEDFSLSWEGESWQVSIPVHVGVCDMQQHERLEHFVEHEIWRKDPDGSA